MAEETEAEVFAELRAMVPDTFTATRRLLDGVQHESEPESGLQPETVIALIVTAVYELEERLIAIEEHLVSTGEAKATEQA
ncbi:hypothetical protein [Propionicimonas sp.]|uniref:hypothetical protein n=1 Tax=Propionicimonas sp. TaxID=1955623 RepID=UPI0039E237CE